MMSCRISYFVLLLSVVVSGCTMRPSGVLNRKEMTDMLFDIHRADATIEVVASKKRTVDMREYYNSVFRKHGVTKEQVDKSMDWYAEHPDELIIIYDSLRVRADILQSKVEAYEFHPDDKPTYLDSISDFDLWKWQREQFLSNKNSKVILSDSLHFTYTDSNYFARGNDLIFDLEMKATSLDLARYTTSLVFHYADSTRDTLAHMSFADTLTRKFHYFKHLPDSVALARLEIILVDEPFYLSTVEIKDVKLTRRYHRYDSPVLPNIRSAVRASRDSVRMARK